MIVKLFDVQNSKLVLTEHCYALPFLKKIMKEYPEDTKKYYNEQLEGFEKERNEDEEAKTRIEQLRDLHRNVFMRHVHVELGKIWEKQEVEIEA